MKLVMVDFESIVVMSILESVKAIIEICSKLWALEELMLPKVIVIMVGPAVESIPATSSKGQA